MTVAPSCPACRLARSQGYVSCRPCWTGARRAVAVAQRQLAGFQLEDLVDKVLHPDRAKRRRDHHRGEERAARDGQALVLAAQTTADEAWKRQALKTVGATVLALVLLVLLLRGESA